MSVKKFKFVSPGVFVNEIDNSQLTGTPSGIGPVVIGRSERGPALRPVRVDSFSDFINTFGNPIPGGQGGDVWRDGNYTAPTYAAYAAQAWLRNNSPINFVRLLGAEHSEATTAGQAGWNLGSPAVDPVSNHGAFGIFMCNSASAETAVTGALAAIVYVSTGSVRLEGNLRNTAASTGSAAALIAGNENGDFTFEATDGSGNTVDKFMFNLDRSSDRYLRKVANTNPTLTNSNITDSDASKTYWIGQTYERAVTDAVTSTDRFAFLLALESGSANGADFGMGLQAPKTGWFISQDLGQPGSFNVYNSPKKLFKLVCMNTGEWEQRNLKVSIQDIKAPQNDYDPYGTFTVVLRKIGDKDAAVQVVERFSQCSLNPNSQNYIGRKIGDRYTAWDETEKRYRLYGNYPNMSKFIRVDMAPEVAAGTEAAAALPFGVYGPLRFKGFSLLSGALDHPCDFFALGTHQSGAGTGEGNSFVEDGDLPWAASAGPNFGPNNTSGIDFGPSGSNTGSPFPTGGLTAFTGAFPFPAIELRSGSADTNLSSPKDAYWGASVHRTATSTRFEESVAEMCRALPGNLDSHTADVSTEHMWIFTLDNLVASGGSLQQVVYVSGSRALEESITALSSSYKAVLEHGYDKFTTVFAGGFDGVDITEKEPFGNHAIGSGERTSYEYNSIKRSIDSLSDPEAIEFNLAAIPGCVNTGLTNHLINTCESRGDALAIIDIENDYTPSTESTNDEATRVKTVSQAVTSMRDRGINSSYGCAFYPWVQIRDTIQGTQLWVPPSVVALGAMASSERSSELWFAPAGFTRGGLTGGAAGIPVIGVRQQLTSKERDTLYQANINPIASFPAEGIVIFGQKTLQATPSALDRINVRRLMIYIKKEISRMAATILFDQNVAATWDRFTQQAGPFLGSVKARLGLSDFKIVLDETTTTPDLVDRNILYAKIYLKPARAIEFIALDFVITNTGAAFED